MSDEEPYDESEEDEGEDQDSSDHEVRFSLQVSSDRDGFFRRSCPSCGRDFKTEIDPADLSWALNTQIQRVSEEVGVPPADLAQEGAPAELRCHYCRHAAEASEMHANQEEMAFGYPLLKVIHTSPLKSVRVLAYPSIHIVQTV